MGVAAIATTTAGSGSYALASWVFLRLLGFIYLVAFISLATQIRGLVGEHGILPVSGLLAGRDHWGAARFWRWPTLCWLCRSDRALLTLTWGGAALAVLLITGAAPLPVLALLWICYLSLFTVCRFFLCYQWDALLLEIGFLALFLAPHELAPHFPPLTPPSSLAVWLFWWLLFRLMFWSGTVKLRSGDFSWRTLVALKYHYETQPLPTPVAWYVHQLPGSFHKASAALVLGIELIVPFLILGPHSCRYVAGGLFVLLMVLIQLTGNYAFFNLLGIVLSIMLLDDSALIPAARFLLHDTQFHFGPSASLANWFAGGASVLVVLLSLEPVARLLRFQVQWPQALSRLFDVLEPFHLVNSYGLFAVMTKWRPEIVVEGSNDGHLWLAYEFKCKPGDVRRAPRFVAPHQPRLDWQMWFAALGAEASPVWFTWFCDRLTEGSPEVLALLATNPFPDAPPQYVRGVLYEYLFTNRRQRRETGEWWRRERRGIYPGSGN